MLTRLYIRNYRCLKHVDFTPGNINVLFGSNGVGKSTFLDALWFVRDCAVRGTAEAASYRHYGIGALADNHDPHDENIRIEIETESAAYRIEFGFASGRIEPFVGERLMSRTRAVEQIQRSIGSSQALFRHGDSNQSTQFVLREPEQLGLKSYLLFAGSKEANEIDRLLHALRYCSSRAVNLHALRRFGSEAGMQTFPDDQWKNLWSALRNLHGMSALDGRYDSIIRYMRQAFPDSFRDLIFEQIGPDRVGGSFVEYGRRRPIPASGVSDGYLQMLGLLACLFGDSRFNLQLFDEPETSLHPHAIAVFGKAVKEAAQDGLHRRIFIATHSPVLLSQFEPEETVVALRDTDRSTILKRVSEFADLKDLLEDYALGSLYMAEQIGQQGDAAELSGEAVP